MATNNATNNYNPGKLLQAKVVQYNPSAAQALTTTYADVDGSSYTFTPVAAAAASNIVYGLTFMVVGDVDAVFTASFKLLVDGVLETESGLTITGGDSSAQGHVLVPYTFTVPSWGASAKTMKLQGREFSASFDTKLHQLYYFDGASSTLFWRPTLLIMEFAT